MPDLSFTQIDEKKIKLIKNMASDLPVVVANPGDLKQVFLNIVMNGIEAMPEGGTLEIRSSIFQNMVEVYRLWNPTREYG